MMALCNRLRHNFCFCSLKFNRISNLCLYLNGSPLCRKQGFLGPSITLQTITPYTLINTWTISTPPCWNYLSTKTHRFCSLETALAFLSQIHFTLLLFLIQFQFLGGLANFATKRLIRTNSETSTISISIVCTYHISTSTTFPKQRITVSHHFPSHFDPSSTLPHFQQLQLP